MPSQTDLTDLQRHAIRLAVAGARPGEVAEAVGVDPATVSRWRRLPAFREAVAEAHAEADLDAAEDLRSLRGLAVATLRDLLAPDAPPAARLAAVREVLRRTEGAPALDALALFRLTEQRRVVDMTDAELYAIAYPGLDPLCDD